MKYLSIIFCIILSNYLPSYATANNFTPHKIVSGDNVTLILRKVGFTGKEREQALAQSKTLRTLFLTLDTRYILSRNQNNIDLRVYDSQTSRAVRVARINSKMIIQEYKPNYNITYQRIDGKIYGSPLGSILSKINSNFVASRFLDAYAFEIRPKDMSRGAAYWLEVEKLHDQGHFIKYGEVVKTSLEIKGEEIVKKFVRNNRGGGVFFHSSDVEDQKLIYAPVDYLKITSHFKPNRLHPIKKIRQPHLGVDFELPVGDPVYAARTGTVARFGYNKAAGHYIVLTHGNNFETAYNHLYKPVRNFTRGQKVRAGQKIGEIGCSGYCTRAHLHFALKKKGVMVNPLTYMKPYPAHMEQTLASKVARN